MLAVVLGPGAGLDDRLGLGDLAGDPALGVLLSALFLLALGLVPAGVQAALLGRFAAAALGLPLGAGLRHQRVSFFAISGSPYAGCDGRTSGRTCAARSGPANFAGICSSRSGGGCYDHTRDSRRFGLQCPCLLY